MSGPFPLSPLVQALQSYLRISEVDRARIHGLNVPFSRFLLSQEICRVGHIIATGAPPPFFLIPPTTSYLNILLNEQYILTLLPGGCFPLFVYVVLGHEIERVRAGLHLLPLEGAGLVNPEGNFVHQNKVVGADLVDAAGVGMAGGAGLGHAAGMIVDGAMGGAGLGHAAGMIVDGAMGGAGPGHAAGMIVDGPGHAAGMVVDGADAGGAGLMHAPDMIVGSEAVGVDLVNAAGMGVGFAGVVEGAAADAGLVDAAGMYDPQVGVAGGTGTVDAAMQHHIDRVSEIIESEDEGAVLDDLPQQEAVAVGPMNLDLLSVNQPPQ